MLRHTATHCNTYRIVTNVTRMRGTRMNTHNTPQHTATHRNTLQHTATHCNTLQHTATHCNTHTWRAVLHAFTLSTLISMSTCATHCNTLQHTATHCNTHIWRAVWHPHLIHFDQYVNVRNTLQHTATHCNTLQHTATRCNTHTWRAVLHSFTLSTLIHASASPFAFFFFE